MLGSFSSRMTCMSRGLRSVQIGVGQQREKARALDRRAELALITRLGPGDACGHDFAVLLHEVLEDVDVLVVDLLDAFGGEAAELAALEQIITAFAALAILAFAFTFGVSSHGTGHVNFLCGSVFRWFRDRQCGIRSRAAQRWCRCGSDPRESRGS